VIHEPVEPAPFAFFTAPASSERIAKVVAALERHNIEGGVVDTGADARARILAMIPFSSYAMLASAFLRRGSMEAQKSSAKFMRLASKASPRVGYSV